jgi:hypothetical protein
VRVVKDHLAERDEYFGFGKVLIALREMESLTRSARSTLSKLAGWSTRMISYPALRIAAAAWNDLTNFLMGT